jgi:hypothetical protein
MKATVITVYDNDGNEIKNVSTEIVLNGETYVKKESQVSTTKRHNPESHLIGMWYKCYRGDEDFGFVEGLWYYFYEPSDNDGVSVLTEKHKLTTGFKDPQRWFDLSNPALDTQTKPIWETCRETMWGYDSDTSIVTNYSTSTSTMNQDVSLYRLNKHLNALAYLSEVARRCNGDRVVDWLNGAQDKFIIERYRNKLQTAERSVTFEQTTFIDKAARDHSFEVDKHIWNDYYNLPNE